MANIIPTDSLRIDKERFWTARAKDLPRFTEILPKLKKKGLSLVEEEVAWMPSREWENGVLKARPHNSVYYRILPDATQEDKLVAGLFTLPELEMLLHDEGPIIRGTREQMALEVIFHTRNPERRP
jgi:hypothetical protein